MKMAKTNLTLESYTFFAVVLLHENLLVALGRFSANVVTTSLQRCFDVEPTFFQRFYNMPLFMAISVLLGIIRSKKKKTRSFWLSLNHLPI